MTELKRLRRLCLEAWEEVYGSELGERLQAAAVSQEPDPMDLVEGLRQERDALAAALDYFIETQRIKIPAVVVGYDPDPSGDTIEYDPDPRAVALFGAENLGFVVGSGTSESYYALRWDKGPPNDDIPQLRALLLDALQHSDGEEIERLREQRHAMEDTILRLRALCGDASIHLAKDSFQRIDDIHRDMYARLRAAAEGK